MVPSKVPVSNMCRSIKDSGFSSNLRPLILKIAFPKVRYKTLPRKDLAVLIGKFLK
jgi:hypothetical protein